MRQFAILVLLSILCGAETPQRTLQPGETIAQDVSGSAEPVFHLSVPPGECIRLTLHEEAGIAGILSIRDSAGAPFVRLDPTFRHPSAKQVTVLDGQYSVSIEPAFHSEVQRIFDLATGEFQAVTAADRQRHAAEQLEGEGEQAAVSYQPGYLQTARSKFEAAAADWERMGDERRLANTLHHLAEVEREQGQMETARTIFERELGIWKTQHDDAGMARALHGLALTNNSNRPKLTIELEDQALDLWRKLKDVRGQAESLLDRGVAESQSGVNEAAGASLEESLKLARQQGYRLIEAQSLGVRGVWQYQLGNYREAAALYSAALSISRQEGLKVDAAKVLSNLGTLYRNSGDPRASISYFEQAISMRKQLESPTEDAPSLYNMAVARHQLGEYQAALDELNQALPLFRQTHYRVAEAYCLQELSSLYLDLGQSEKSEVLLRQALEIRRAGSDKRGESQTLLRLGELHASQGNVGQAIEEDRQALAIAQAAGYSFEQAQALAAEAGALIDSKDFPGALAAARQQLEISRKLGNKIEEARGLELSGRAKSLLGDAEKARQDFVQAAGLDSEMGAQADEAQALFELGRAEQKCGLTADAEKHALTSLDLAESLRANIGSRQSRLHIASSHRPYYESAISLAMQANEPGMALEISERGRARGLIDLLAEAQVDLRQGVSPSLVERERETGLLLDAKHERLLRLLDSPHSAASETALRDEIDQLVDSYRQAEGEILATSPQYATLTRPKLLNLYAVEQWLPEDTVLMEFWLGEEQSFAWVVSRTECRAFVLPPREKIDQLVNLAREALAAHTAIPSSTIAGEQKRLRNAAAQFHLISVELAHILKQPLQVASQSRRLWIVADGSLAYVPFAALPDPGSGRPLAQRHQISMLASASAAAAEEQQNSRHTQTSGELAIFADPVFSSDDERVQISHKAALKPVGNRVAAGMAADPGLNSLPRLPYSRQEAEAISRLTPLHLQWIALGFNANRAAAESAKLSRYRIVHFATHALIDNQHPELSAIVLSMVDRRNHSEDGILHLSDIYGLQLNARLVVLSGCETALGSAVRSEGLVGLTQGFFYAGSRQVMASLWSVQDRSTAELMQFFYRGLLRQKLDAASALQAAQLAMMRDTQWSDPYYWASFVVQGVAPRQLP